jgi:BirA family transcriptional regulator, biotin operon repressor / biotin---[acetyl-CoA-carboxylase] ligase
VSKLSTLNVDLIRQGCDFDHPERFDWLYKTETGSTNRDVLEHYENSHRHVICVAESQTSGRGRRGRQWLSPFAKNIYCTIGMQVDIPAKSMGLTGILTGLALCESLQQSGYSSTRLKWPNDLLLDGLKLGGILIESRIIGSQFFLAIGFGINVHISEAELAGANLLATSLEISGKSPVDRAKLLMSCISEVIKRIDQFDENQIGDLKAEFKVNDAYHLQPVTALLINDKVDGLNCGINSAGQIGLETENGLQYFSAADISLRLQT